MIRNKKNIYLSVFRIVTNCLMSDETALTLEIQEFKKFTSEIVKVFEFFNDFKREI